MTLNPLYRQDGWEAASWPYLEITLCFIVATAALEAVLDLRQLRKFKEGLAHGQPPKELSEAVQSVDATPAPSADATPAPSAVADDADGDAQGKQHPPKLLESIQQKFVKSCAYGHDKLTFSLFTSAFSITQAVAGIVGGWLPYVWDLSVALLREFAYGWHTNEIAVSLLFAFLIAFADQIISLPFALYSTFIIESKHGFNKQTLATFFMDTLKGLLLSTVLGAPILAALITIVRMGGDYFFVAAWAFIFVVSLFLMTIYPTFIAPLFNKFSPLEDGALKTGIQELAERVRFPLSKIYMVDGSTRSAHSNAYFYGFFKNKRIVLYDTLFTHAKMNDEEVMAILGHELGHWVKNHVVQGIIISQVYILAAFALFAHVKSDSNLYSAFGFAASKGNVDFVPVAVALILFFQTIWAPVESLLSFAMNMLSRKNEYEADDYANSLGYNQSLQRGLVKIHIENLGNLCVDKWYSAYHSSHPSLVERLQALVAKARKHD